MNTCLIVSLLIQCFDKCISPLRYLSKQFLYEAIAAGEEDVRLWIAKAMAFEPNESTAVEVLSRLVNDIDEMVRVEAVDSLGYYFTEVSFRTLCAASSDNSELVRAYAYYGIATTGLKLDKKNAKYILESALKKENCNRVKIDIYAGLYLLGEKSALAEIQNLFECGDYLTQCAVLNTLEDIATSSNSQSIMKFLELHANAQYKYAVSSTLDRVYRSLLRYR